MDTPYTEYNFLEFYYFIVFSNLLHIWIFFRFYNFECTVYWIPSIWQNFDILWLLRLSESVEMTLTRFYILGTAVANGLRCKKLSHYEKNVCDALRNLVSFARFKKREKHPSRSVTFSKVAGWVFFKSFKLYKWYQIAQSIT